MHSTQHSHPHPHSQRVPFATQPQSQSPSVPSNHFYLQNQSIPRTFSPQGQPHQTTLNSNSGSTTQDNVNHYSTPQNYQLQQQQQHNPNQNQILASPISQSPVPMTPVGLQGGPPTPSSLKGLAPRLSIPQSNNNQSHHQLNMNIQRSPSASGVNQLQGNNPNGNPQNPPNRTTSMGPPLSANPINQNQNINFQIALNQQQNRNSSISPNASNHLSLSLPGAGMLRMLQYAEGLSTGIQKASYHYWRDFVSEFFLPDATFRLVLWNPASCEQKGFEVPSSVLPRYYHTTCTSGLTSSQVNFENPREHLGQSSSIPPPIVSKFANVFPSATSSHFFESSRTNLISTFDNGWQVQMNGSLRASLVIRNNSLKIENLDFTVNAHTSFLPGVAIQRRKVSQKIPLDVIDKIRKDVENEVSGRKIKGESEDDKNKNDPDGDGKKMKKDNRPDTPASSKRSDGNQDDKSLEEKDEKDADGGIKNESPNSSQRTDRNDENEIGSAYTIMVDQTFLPESPVNEYGITLRAMRCLEITESVCQLRDLIDHSHSRKLGPMEALRNFSDQFRMQQRLQNQNQPQSQNPPGFSPINVNGNNGFATPVNGGFPAQFGQMNQGSGSGIEMQNGFDRPSPSQNQNQGQNQSQVEGSAENGNNANKRKSSVRINSRDPTPSPSQTPKRIAPSPKLGGRRGAITEDDINPNQRAREG